MTLPTGLTRDDLLAVPDVVGRARLLAAAAHAGQQDKAGEDYVTGHLTDVWERARASGAPEEDQAAALLHDVVEDTDVTDEDLWACGFSDRTLLVVHLLTRREGEADGVYYARIRAYEPARRLKLGADVASNTDPLRLGRLDEATRTRLVEKYARATQALTLPEQEAVRPPPDPPALVLLRADDAFTAANALRALGGAPPLPHEVNTLGEVREDGFAWFAECSCGWRGQDRTDEVEADLDRIGHDDDVLPHG